MFIVLNFHGELLEDVILILKKNVCAVAQNGQLLLTATVLCDLV